MIECANHKFEDLAIGQYVETKHLVKPEIIDEFASLSCDYSPIHVDEQAARSAGYAARVAHGALIVAWISEIVGMRLPGRRALLVDLDVQFRQPILANDLVKIRAQINAMSPAMRHVELKVRATVLDCKVASARVGVIVR